MPATATPTFGARMVPRLVSMPTMRSPLLHEARDFAVLDDVDTEPVGGVRIAPGDGIVAGGAAARLQQPADDREARLVG